MYVQWRGTFYVQLEDDILTKPNFTSTMRDFVLEKTAAHENWFVINFCQLGFIGKMFLTSDLPLLIQFLLLFYNDKPVDWLLDNFLTTKVCGHSHTHKQCMKELQSLQMEYEECLLKNGELRIEKNAILNSPFSTNHRYKLSMKNACLRMAN